MLIERQRQSPNGAFNTSSLEQLGQIEARAHDEFIAYLCDMGEIKGDDYVVCIVKGSHLDPDLQSYVGDITDDCYVEESASEWDTRLTVFNMATRQGVQRQVKKNHPEPEYYELDESSWGRFGNRLLAEILEPGKYPELSDLAKTKYTALVDPAELPARIMTPAEYQRAVATARLSQFTVANLCEVLNIYYEVAYTGREYQPMRTAEREQLHHSLHNGESVGLRTGTKYLDCAKHELRVDRHKDELRTRMYLNYDIPFGSMKLHFRDDIDMAVNFGERATTYFLYEGIELLQD